LPLASCLQPPASSLQPLALSSFSYLDLCLLRFVCFYYLLLPITPHAHEHT
jgi:hypothetical protein